MKNLSSKNHFEQVIYENPAPSTNQTITSQPKRRLPYILASLTFCFLLILGTLTLTYLYRSPLISPLGELKQILGFGPLIKPHNKIVYGFLPYWNLKNTNISYTDLTHLALFGISYNPDGTIKTREADYAEPGWRNLTTNTTQIRSDAKSANVKLILVLTAFDNDTIESIISSPPATATLIQETLAFMELYQYDGINIDFEYVGKATPTQTDNFTNFVSQLTQATKERNPDYHTSIDVYADSINNKNLWNIAELGQLVDHIFIMAYDFYRPNSNTSGPVAPLYGGQALWRTDITTLIRQHLEINPPKNLIFA